LRCASEHGAEVVDKLREELTLAKLDRHAEAGDELHVEGILAFAERILPRASDLWMQASPDYKQRLQQLFFPEGIAFDGNRFSIELPQRRHCSTTCRSTKLDFPGTIWLVTIDPVK